MKNILILILGLLFGINQAQHKKTSTYFLSNIGYSNLNGNYFKLGPELYFVQTNDNIIDISLTANMAYFKDQFVVVPELGIGYQFNTGKYSKTNPYREYINASFYTARVKASPWNINPELGFTFLGILEFNAGYSFEIQKHDYTSFDGISFGIKLHIPNQLIF